MTPLVLTGIAVAFAFRCGLFNIGGQGQYWVGFFAALYVGTNLEERRDRSTFSSRSPPSIVAGGSGADRRDPEGDRGCPRGDHDDHAELDRDLRRRLPRRDRRLTGRSLRSRGPTPSSSRPSSGRSGGACRLPRGIFIALFALVVYHLILNRTTLGFEVRAVGFNPEAARYSGISVAKNYFLALAISGAFAGPRGSVDLLGFKSAVSTGDFATNLIAFTGIAVALLGRNKAVGILFAALLFAPPSRSGRRRGSSIPRSSSPPLPPTSRP